MIQALIGPLTELAGGWLKGKADKQAAEAQLKLSEAEAKAKILLSKETSIADWERVMAEGSKTSWKDEWFVIVLSIPLVLAFIPGAEGWVDRGFALPFTSFVSTPHNSQNTGCFLSSPLTKPVFRFIILATK